ncbi:hypothetical protein [Streptomyces sp. CA-179760]|uniref:hypothetical protein n=1 Tax=Streptomyces sp. CA-179760 TaxID=3240054 RepID=UPI003D8D2FD0
MSIALRLRTGRRMPGVVPPGVNGCAGRRVWGGVPRRGGRGGRPGVVRSTRGTPSPGMCPGGLPSVAVPTDSAFGCLAAGRARTTLGRPAAGCAHTTLGRVAAVRADTTHDRVAAVRARTTVGHLSTGRTDTALDRTSAEPTNTTLARTATGRTGSATGRTGSVRGPTGPELGCAYGRPRAAEHVSRPARAGVASRSIHRRPAAGHRRGSPWRPLATHTLGRPRTLPATHTRGTPRSLPATHTRGGPRRSATTRTRGAGPSPAAEHPRRVPRRTLAAPARDTSLPEKSGAAVAAIHAGHPPAQLRAACRRAFVVVLGPGEVEAEGVGLLPGGGRGEEAAQAGMAFGGVSLLAEHDVQPVPEGVAAARPGIVRGERGGMKGPGAFRLRARAPGTVLPGEVLQQCLHHIPGRHLMPVEAGPHALRVTLPEHRAPAAGRIQACQQTIQVVRELPDPARELIRRHRSTPARPELSAP